MLEVRDLVVAHGSRPVLGGANLRVREREIVALIGRNAAGKTTLLKAIMGLLPVLSGSIRLAAEDITSLAPHRRTRLGLRYVPQGGLVFAGLTVRENLQIGADLIAGERAVRVESALAAFPALAERRHRKAESLSGGEQQLLALARALVGEPAALLLDEPTAGVQPSAVEEIADRLRAVSAGAGVPMILVEHNVELVAALATRVCVVANGRVDVEIAPEQLHDEAVVRTHLTV